MLNESIIHSYFAHPVFQYKLQNYQDHNKGLTKYIHQLYTDDKEGVKKTNINGWHSKPFNFSEKESAAIKFFKVTQGYVADVFKKYGWLYDHNKIVCNSMWSIINKKDNFNIEHTHPNNYISASYYVKTPKDCGRFVVTNPNTVNRDRFPKQVNRAEFNRNVAHINVEEGDLLIFPSYLPHYVEPNKSDEDRVVVSFNIDILK